MTTSVYGYEKLRSLYLKYSNLDTHHFWMKMLEHLQFEVDSDHAPYAEEFLKFVKINLVLVPSTAECERDFSVFTDVLTLKRLSTSAKGTEAVVVIRINTKNTQFIPPEFFYDLAIRWETNHLSTASRKYLTQEEQQFTEDDDANDDDQAEAAHFFEGSC